MELSEQRLEGRMLCADLVHVTWLDNAVASTREAVLEDISPLGACVQVERQIPLGVEITIIAEVENESRSLCGVVSYCLYRDFGYFVGIRFLDQAHWSSQVFRPEHMIDPQ